MTTNPSAGRSAREELRAALRLMEQGHIRAAQQSLEALVNAVPSYLAAWTALGELQYMRQNDAGAMACFHRAATLAGNDYSTLINLARCYLTVRATDLAESTLCAAERIEPEGWQTHLGFARLRISQGDFDKALEALARVLKAKPDHVEAHYLTAETQLYVGQLDEAADRLVEALRIARAKPANTTSIPAILYLATQNPAIGQRIDFAREVNLFESKNASPDGEAQMNLALARSYSLAKDGRHKEAWDSLILANDIAWRGHASAEAKTEREADETISGFVEGYGQVRSGAIRSEKTVTLLITGPSRSGKSTLERVVQKAFGNVTVGYEAGLVQEALVMTSVASKLPLSTRLNELPSNVNGQFSKAFGEVIRSRARGGRILTDTSPKNAGIAGPVVKHGRNVFVVFMRRNHADNTLRCLQKTYKSANAFSYNVDECHRAFKWHDDITSRWCERLPGRSMTVDYEALVEDPNAIVTRISDAIGIDPERRVGPIADDRGCATPFATHSSQ